MTHLRRLLAVLVPYAILSAFVAALWWIGPRLS